MNLQTRTCRQMHTHTGPIQVVNTHTLREDRELKEFFLSLVSMFLDPDSSYSRIDLLQCPVAGSREGEALLVQMRKLLRVPVFASSDILGDYITEDGERGTGYGFCSCECMCILILGCRIRSTPGISLFV